MQKNHKNYKNIWVVLFCLLANGLFAQYPNVKERIINLPNFDKRPVHYGYFLGMNQYDFKFDYVDSYYKDMMYKDIAVIQKKGFNVGLIGDLRINDYFNVRFEPGLYYNLRELVYPEYPQFIKESDRNREVKSTYIHLPIYIKINAKRINNFRPFLLGGFSSDFNLSSNAKNSDDNASNVFRTSAKNLNYELGLGFEFYLYYFKFSPSFRGIFSFQNELIPDEVGQASPWTGNIINMFSRGVSLIITFE
ncbi:porin family protein [Flavobacteriaceae bacterium]|nr:porin family protein [Flavobacteriaceae bacterium]